MFWAAVGAIFVIGWILAFTGIIHVARDLWHEDAETHPRRSRNPGRFRRFDLGKP